MLFDTSSPGRKRVIRIVYGGLALIFVVGFLGFGIGTSGSLGGLFDALGITDSSSGGSGDSALQQQIDDLEAQAKKNPDNTTALTSLVNVHFRQAVAKFSDNHDLEDARPDLEAALSAWERYLKTDPKQPSITAAPFAAQAYAALGDYKGAAKAQQFVVDADPTQIQQYLTLATYFYADGDFANGQKTAKQAEAQAKGKKLQAKVKKTFAQLETKAHQQQKAAKAQSEASGQPDAGLGSPFGALGGSGTTPSTTAP